MHVNVISSFLFPTTQIKNNKHRFKAKKKQEEEATNMNNHEEATNTSSSSSLGPQQTNQFVPHTSPPPSPFKSSENHRQSDGNIDTITGSQRSKSTPPPPPASTATTTSTSTATTTPTRRRSEESGRERLKRHRVEVAGRVRIPEMWGQEELLKDWIDCSAFDDSLFPTGLMSARAALVNQVVQVTRRPNGSSALTVTTLQNNRC